MQTLTHELRDTSFQLGSGQRGRSALVRFGGGCAAGRAHYGVLLRTSGTGAGTSVGACSKGLSLVRQLTLAQDIDPSKIRWDVDSDAERGAAVPSCRYFSVCRYLVYVLA